MKSMIDHAQYPPVRRSTQQTFPLQCNGRRAPKQHIKLGIVCIWIIQLFRATSYSSFSEGNKKGGKRSFLPDVLFGARDH